MSAQDTPQPVTLTPAEYWELVAVNEEGGRLEATRRLLVAEVEHRRLRLEQLEREMAETCDRRQQVLDRLKAHGYDPHVRYRPDHGTQTLVPY